MKVIEESLEEPGILVTRPKVSLRTTGLATQLFKIKDQYERLVKRTETMESAKYTIEETVQAIQEIDFGEDSCGINRYIKKKMQNNDIYKIMNIGRPDILPAAYSLLQHFQPTTACAEIVSQGKKL